MDSQRSIIIGGKKINTMPMRTGPTPDEQLKMTICNAMTKTTEYKKPADTMQWGLKNKAPMRNRVLRTQTTSPIDVSLLQTPYLSLNKDYAANDRRAINNAKIKRIDCSRTQPQMKEEPPAVSFVCKYPPLGKPKDTIEFSWQHE